MPPSLRNVKFPNGFYVILLLTSTLFVMTCMAWLVSPALREISEKDRASGASVQRVDPRSLALGDWIDKNAVKLLTVEFSVMLVTGLLAIGLDTLIENRHKKS
ncbi:MAG: hypothetical protein WCJ40_04860 [Planctomycetota bacterium]